MSRFFPVLLAGLSILLLASSAVPAKALMVAPAPIAQRVATADMVLVGKVTSIEPKTIKAKRFPGDTEPAEYQIAVVKIEDAIQGTRGLTHIRVGFIPPAQGVGGGGRPRPIVSSARRMSVTLAKDEVVCLFLKAHPDAAFHTAPNYFDVIRMKLAKRDNPAFAPEVAEAKQAAKLLADPSAGLKSASAADRFTTAAMLLLRYRQVPPGPQPKTEPIDPTESKLILSALADADWNAQQPKRFALQPQNAFALLGLKPADGWTQPKDYRQYPAEAKKWLVANKDRYRVQRYVTAAPTAP